MGATSDLQVLFGYRHVKGIPLCPCKGPGNYAMMEQRTKDPLECHLRCWCGRTLKVTFSDMAEREEFLEMNSKEE